MEESLRREIKEEVGVTNIVAVIEGLYYFEFSDPGPYKEYVYGVEISSSEDIVLDGREHSEYRWCSLQDALQLLHWEENKVALRKLDTILTQQPK